MEASPTQFRRLRLRAFALGCGVFLLFAGVTAQLSQFVEEHEYSERRSQLERDASTIKQHLETGLRERVTLIDQAISYWLHSEEVTRSEFKGYAHRLLAGSPLFLSLGYGGPDFKLKWVEPEEYARGVVGLDYSVFPDRFPGMTSQQISDRIRIGSVYRLIAVDKDGFNIVAPVFKEGRFEGFLSATVVLEDLLRPVFATPPPAARHVRLVASNDTRPLFETGPPLRSDAILHNAPIQVLDLHWELQTWWQPDEETTALLEANESILLLGLVTAALLGLTMGTLWMGKQRLRESEAILRRNYSDLERANRQSEQAIGELERTNTQLESANDQLETANERLESANLQLANANTQLETANDQLGQKNEELAGVNFELETANTSLRDLNKELDDFTHVVSHDLKEPLRGIQAFSQFLVEDYGDKLDDMGRSYLENLMSSASRMQGLINDLMQLARVTKTRANAQAVDMNGVLKTALQDLAYSIQSRKAVVDVPPDLPQVWGDPVHLQIVVKNLLSNALKYNDKEDPRIDVRWYDRGTMIEFRFQDNGIGIDPRFQKKIFELFERLVTQEEYEGTGAGLAISRKIIEQHGGTIWVESKPGEGSTFCFTVPRVDYGWSRLATNPRGIPIMPPGGAQAVTISGSYPVASPGGGSGSGVRQPSPTSGSFQVTGPGVRQPSPASGSFQVTGTGEKPGSGSGS